MSWNASLNYNNLYRAVLSLQAVALTNPINANLNMNSYNITNANTITTATLNATTLNATTLNATTFNTNTISSTSKNNLALTSTQYTEPPRNSFTVYSYLDGVLGQITVLAFNSNNFSAEVVAGSRLTITGFTGTPATLNGTWTSLPYSATYLPVNTTYGVILSGWLNTFTAAGQNYNGGINCFVSLASGGTVNITSTNGLVSTTSVSAVNLNGKLNIVGQTTSTAGNVVYTANTTNTTGNYDLLTDASQHFTFTGGSGANSNQLIVGGATNGSIVVPSTAGFITAPTISNGANDFTIGTSSSLYTTVYSTNINNSLYPSAPYGSQSGSFCWNANAFGGEFSFMNNFGSSASGGFTFNDRTGTSSKRLLAKITENNFDIGVNANLTVGNGSINASPSGATLSLYASNNGSVNLIARSGGNIGFYTNNGGGSGGNFNAMTINSFASGGVQSGYIDIFHANGVASGSAFEQFVYNGLVIGAILQSGTTAISIYYGSDYRLKSNVKPIDTSLLYRLKPCSFTWTQDNRDDIGFIAHEFQEVFPDSVINQKDQVDENGKPKIQMMSNTVCIPLLVACVKEHQQQIVNQQEQIATLESKLASLTALVESLIAGRV